MDSLFEIYAWILLFGGMILYVFKKNLINSKKHIVCINTQYLSSVPVPLNNEKSLSSEMDESLIVLENIVHENNECSKEEDLFLPI